VYAGISVAADGDARTYAINAATGRPAWQATGPRPYVASSGAVFGFTVTGRGATDVVATSATSGRKLWTHDAGPLLDNAKVGWLAYADGLVYVAAGTTENSTSGQPTVAVLPGVPGLLLVTGGTVCGSVLSASGGSVFALDAATGRRLWHRGSAGSQHHAQHA
jgi:outer membrane protein assembly factor BamB